MFGGTRRYYRDITERNWYCGTYPYTEVPVSTTKLILVLRILYLYYEAYPGLTELILVLLNLFLYFKSYTCITELIHVFQILYLSYRAYTCLMDLILVLWNMYLSYGSYTCFTELILIFRISYWCEGTRRYDKSEQIRIISHTRSDQTYADTYQIWTLVHSRYGSQQIHIPDSYRFKTYPKTNRLSVYIIIIFRVTLARRYP